MSRRAEMILRPEVLITERYVEQWAHFYDGDPDYVRVGDDEFSQLAGKRYGASRSGS